MNSENGFRLSFRGAIEEMFEVHLAENNPKLLDENGTFGLYTYSDSLGYTRYAVCFDYDPDNHMIVIIRHFITLKKARAAFNALTAYE